MITIPENTISAIAYEKRWQDQQYLDQIFETLKGNFKRDWFVPHAYHCLPLFMGNQHGFVVKSLWDFEVEWNGGDKQDDVIVNILSDKEEYEQKHALQSVKAHFGMGTFTIQTAFTLRTPPGINLMTINPPNYYIDGLYFMTGVIESDNLRRDFTFNTRITRANFRIKINKGDYIGCVIPYPRHFIDHYQIVEGKQSFTDEELEQERQCGRDFAKEREGPDRLKAKGNGKRYYRGVDIYNNKFPDHQNNLDK
jgi:hypothetical protein